ncbi:type II secretion system F family protein [Actinokineospora globicatena]|uniref:type II secretion system F family protein n=1 Tax=Actinokineospora globicatena TaxID=103729 RepID=UPI0020A3223F|nr:type II secretion system F family protein [Actinokineospora globicatena]MCP2300961.1 Type II secretion system (T2SS), protein F [Actinokineospora globicatena]GLW77408.1 hypothetical protein Aglo01_18900 [Actinokineospora globicatena]GLW84242.1 hypothetical protein Aglo02_18820 [Actinokineospora globicatena]
MIAAVLLLAMAVLVGKPHAPGRRRFRRVMGLTGFTRPTWLVPVFVAVAVASVGVVVGGVVVGLVVGVAGWWGARWLLRPRQDKVDDLRLAATWDMLAACLRVGMPVPTAILAVGEGLPGRAGSVLRDVAEQLALGADPRQAWATAVESPETAALARAARRTARSGAALAEVASRLAGDVRAGVDHAAEARAQRAGVLITLPLGLCFLPAFLCVGVLPVVIGLAARAFHLSLS